MLPVERQLIAGVISISKIWLSDYMGVQRGFSLVELMVALAVLVILVTIAVPSFTGSLLRANASGLADSLITSLNYARSEAITRNARITVCARNATGTGCLNGAINWDDGWVIRSADNTILRDVQINTQNAQVTEPNHSAKRLQFKASGELVLLDAANVESQAQVLFSTQIANCNDPQLNIRREITIAISGLISVAPREPCNP